jgi:hypothetical protein
LGEGRLGIEGRDDDGDHERMDIGLGRRPL